MTQLTENFLIELFDCCLRNKDIFQIVRTHLEYQFLPHESYKKVWKSMVDYFDSLQSLPTIGIISQQYAKDPDVLAITAAMRQLDLAPKEGILKQFEEFIRQSIFIETHDKLAELYTNGDKEKAFQLLSEASEKLSNFSLKSTGYFEEAFGGFQKRYDEKKTQIALGKMNYSKVPFSIDEADAITHGGMNRGDIALFLAQSGVGKTKLLRHIGVGAARRGLKVAHLQGEGTKQECLDGYDATWSGAKLYHIEHADITAAQFKDIHKIIKDIKKVWKGEIYIESFEQFGSASMLDVRNTLLEMTKVYGHIDLVLLDYFELFEPGDGKYYKVSEERSRREKLGRTLKNIAMEFGTCIVTATQASTVSPDQLNDPDFAMTRYNVREFKAVTEPFSYFASLNQTTDERDECIMRIHWDKIRKYKGGQTMRIYTDYDNERFYDRYRTINSTLIQQH